MATRYSAPATKQAGAAYDPAIKDIGAQVPAIQSLYNKIVNNVGDTAGSVSGGLLDLAGNLGVDGYDFDAANAGFISEANRQGDILRGDAARAKSAIGVTKGEAMAGRAETINTLTGALQTEDLARRETAAKISDLERNQTLSNDVQRAQMARAAAEKAAAEAAATAAGATMAMRGAVGSDPIQDGAHYAFKDAQGNEISAGQYALQTGQDIRDVIGYMGQNGDKYAQQVYNQLVLDPNPGARIEQYKKLYAPLFRGV